MPNNNIFNARQLDFEPVELGLPRINNPHPVAEPVTVSPPPPPPRVAGPQNFNSGLDPVNQPSNYEYTKPQPTSVSVVSSGPPRRSSKIGRTTRPAVGTSRNYGVTGRRVVGGR